VITLLWVFLDEYGWTNHAVGAGGETGRRGAALFVLWMTGLTGGYIGLRRWYASTRAGALQAVFVLLATVFITLTVIGMAFRGPGMRLTWPGG
jgi:hypothetical protein